MNFTQLRLSIPILLLLSYFATTTAYAHVTLAPHPDHTSQSPERRAAYIQNRIKYITEVAQLTPEEQSILAKELEVYDTNKLDLFTQALELRKRIEQEKLSDAEAGKLLEQALRLEEQRSAETTKLFTRLEGKISKAKLSKVYIGLMDYRHHMGKKIRDRGQ